VWKGIALAERSGLERSLGMLKQARQTLEAALAVNPNPYATDAYTTLGSMYANAPGFPLSFGSQKKARELYEKALSINATGIGSNLNYAQFLLKAEDYAGALKHAAAVLAAPPRPGRERADQAARTSAERLIARAREKLRE
jgi:Tfp pilus assembly protein PilF